MRPNKSAQEALKSLLFIQQFAGEDAPYLEKLRDAADRLMSFICRAYRKEREIRLPRQHVLKKLDGYWRLQGIGIELYGNLTNRGKIGKESKAQRIEHKPREAMLKLADLFGSGWVDEIMMDIIEMRGKAADAVIAVNDATQ